MSFCPDCGKRFTNKMWVLQHMNQPSNTCSLWMNKLSQAYCSYSHAAARIYMPQYQPCSNHDIVPEVDDASAYNGFAVNEDPVYNPNDGQQEDAPGLIVDAHPSTPSIYPGGTTFMDQFFADQYAGFRQENLYYPFASRVDWQLTSWLLHSCLSMVAIDNFLSLELVCQFFKIPSLKPTHITDQATANFLSICKRAKALCRNATIRSQVSRPHDAFSLCKASGLLQTQV